MQAQASTLQFLTPYTLQGAPLPGVYWLHEGYSYPACLQTPSISSTGPLPYLSYLTRPHASPFSGQGWDNPGQPCSGSTGCQQPPEARQLPTTQKRALKAAAPQSPCTAQYGVAGPATDGAAPPQPPASPQHPWRSGKQPRKAKPAPELGEMRRYSPTAPHAATIALHCRPSPHDSAPPRPQAPPSALSYWPTSAFPPLTTSLDFSPSLARVG